MTENKGSRSQWLAQILFDLIGNCDKPVRRPKNPSVDRALREMIAKSAIEHKALIINSGEGYYMPRAEDAPAVREYIAKERSKAKAITERVDAIEEMFDEILKKALPEGSTTKTTYIVNESRGEINGCLEN